MAKTFRDLIEPYRVTHGKGFRLKHMHPWDTGGLEENKQAARDMLAEGQELLCELQEKLYAQDRWALLLILQAMDAAGKDGTIKHVMSGVNPQGCDVTSFKTPSDEDLDHDFLWRASKAFPQRGKIGIFNRSYYEEVLVVRVHPELLEKQKLPPSVLGKHFWRHRFEAIRGLETYLGRNGVSVLKCFLHLSRHEQRKRLLARLDDKSKTWKFSAADTVERGFWDEYMEAYEDAIRSTATEEAPWFVIPADNKWFTRLVVAGAVVEALEAMKLAYPTIDKRKRVELEGFRAALEKGRTKKGAG